MTKTSATGFATSSLGFENPDALLRKTRGTELSSMTRTAAQGASGKNIEKKSSSMINFGRNTLYNPKPTSDPFEMFAIGDAQATSAAAASLVRPTCKPESRRSSTNSNLGLTNARKGMGLTGGMKFTSRNESSDEK
jgi:hypothetical protein